VVLFGYTLTWQDLAMLIFYCATVSDTGDCILTSFTRGLVYRICSDKYWRYNRICRRISYGGVC